MPRILKLKIGQREFLSELRKIVDEKPIDSWPKSNKPLYGRIIGNEFEFKVSNTYGTKPIVSGTMNQEEDLLVIKLTWRHTIPTKIIFAMLASSLVTFGISGYLSGFILAIPGTIALIGLIIFFLVIISKSEFAQAVTLFEFLETEQGRKSIREI